MDFDDQKIQLGILVIPWYWVGQEKSVWLMNMLFNKVLGENEKCLLFLLETEQTFWPIQYLLCELEHNTQTQQASFSLTTHRTTKL